MIRRRKRSFLIKQHASADGKSITIIVAVLEYHFGSLRILLQSSPRKELSALSQRDQFSYMRVRVCACSLRAHVGSARNWRGISVRGVTATIIKCGLQLRK